MLKPGIFLRSLIMLGVAALLFLVLQGCDRLSVKQDLDGVEYTLVDQDSSQVTFPDSFAGKVVLIGYVYTSCPDICPLITYNMRDVQRKVNNDDFMLVSVSFDPERDAPAVLAKYAQNYKLNQNNWRLLTGKKKEIQSMLDELDVTAIKSPTRFTEDNKPIYFINHTDKVSLIDKNGKIRRSYSGSELNSDKVVEDIQSLLDET